MLQLRSSISSCVVIVTSIKELPWHGQLKKKIWIGAKLQPGSTKNLYCYLKTSASGCTVVLNASRIDNAWPSVTQLLTPTESLLHSQSTSLSIWHPTKEITCLEMYKECNYYSTTFTFLQMWCSKWLTVSYTLVKARQSSMTGTVHRNREFLKVRSWMHMNRRGAWIMICAETQTGLHIKWSVQLPDLNNI